MAQRKSPPAKATGKPVGAKTSGASSTSKTSSPGARPTRPAGRPPQRKPGKSIVNQKQTPWGLISVTAAIVAFAVAIVVIVVVTHKSSPSANAAWEKPEIAAAKQIKGLQFKLEPNHTHVFTTVKYDTSPPTGGNHSQIWADCSGTIYPKQIANENAVHMLEHGAVWITYRPGLAASQLAVLKPLVDGVDRMAMSPYAGLKTPISLQAWGYQLFVNSASDPRITQFIAALRKNPNTMPEPASAATCTDPQFVTDEAQSYPGHPIFNLSS